MEYQIQQYELVQGALEIQYIEEFFGEFPRKKTASEIVGRLVGRAHSILLATAPLTDDPGTVVPVSFKVAHEIKAPEKEPKLVDLMHRLRIFHVIGSHPEAAARNPRHSRRILMRIGFGSNRNNICRFNQRSSMK